MRGQQKAGVPRICLFLRPTVRHAPVFGYNQCGTARTADAPEGVFRIIGENIGTLRYKDNVGNFLPCQNICPIQPRQKCGRARSVCDNGDMPTLYPFECRLKPCLPFPYALTGRCFGHLNDGITDRPTVYPHLILSGIAYQPKRQIFEFKTLHTALPISAGPGG